MGRPFLSSTIVEPASVAPVPVPKPVDEPAVWRESAFDVDSDEFAASAVWEWWAEDAHGILGGPTPVSGSGNTNQAGDQALALLAAEESDDTDSASESHVTDETTVRDDQRVPLLFTANNEDGWTEVSRAVPSVDVDPVQPSAANLHGPEADDDDHDSDDDATDEDTSPDSSPELRTRPLDRVEIHPRSSLPTHIVRPLVPFSTALPTPTPAYPLAAR